LWGGETSNRGGTNLGRDYLQKERRRRSAGGEWALKGRKGGGGGDSHSR